MYKIFKRYYGELCDKEWKEDEEVFDEEEICEVKDKTELSKKITELIEQAKKEGYILDEECRKGDIRLFFDYQENWLNYFEIYIKEVDLLNVYASDLYKNTLIDNIIEEINKYYKKLKADFIERQADRLVSELSLIYELKAFLENEKTKSQYKLKEIELIYKDTRVFIDEIVEMFYNTELGNSYADLSTMIDEFIKDFTE